MTKFRIVENASGPETEPYSEWAPKCPDALLVASVGGRIKVLSHCGRYFECCSDELDTLEGHSEHYPDTELPDGIHICEGSFVSSIHWESGHEEGGWEPGEFRSLQPEEWARYCDGEEPWPDEYYNPQVEAPPSTAAPLPEACLITGTNSDPGRYVFMPRVGAYCDPLPLLGA